MLQQTKVAIFVDGKNFYEGLRASGNSTKVSFKDLSDEIMKFCGGNMLTGLHYFTGVERTHSSDEKVEKSSLEGFLSYLKTQPACFVYAFPRRVRTINCKECGKEHVYSEEKAVDTSLVAQMIGLAATGAFDVAVLCSGDADHIPALNTLRDFGKPTWVATFGNHGLSRSLREAAYGHIDLTDIYNRYTVDGDDIKDEDVDVIGALIEAQEHFGSDRYVGFSYFLNKWRSSKLPINLDERESLIQELIDEGNVQVYDAEDGCKAIRAVNTQDHDDVHDYEDEDEDEEDSNES